MKRKIEKLKSRKAQGAKAILPPLFILDEEDMLTLTKREIGLFSEAQPDYAIYLIETSHQDSRWWRMCFKVPSQNKSYEVVTERGTTKLWKRMDIAIDFIKEVCPTAKAVFVVFST